MNDPELKLLNVEMCAVFQICTVLVFYIRPCGLNRFAQYVFWAVSNSDVVSVLLMVDCLQSLESLASCWFSSSS